MTFDVSGIDMPSVNIYVKDNPVCDVEVNQEVFNMMPSFKIDSTLTGAGITHGNVQGANNDTELTTLLDIGLSLG